jgi:hypothetical protein
MHTFFNLFLLKIGKLESFWKLGGVLPILAEGKCC